MQNGKEFSFYIKNKIKWVEGVKTPLVLFFVSKRAQHLKTGHV
jgi:hypothetical protein